MFPVYTQHDKMDCGPTCLRMVAKFYGKHFSLQTLRDKCHITRLGVSMLGISEGAESIGMHTIGAAVSLEQLLTKTQLPCIIHWKNNHFVVIFKIKKKRSSRDKTNWMIKVADPLRGIVTYNEIELKKAWLSKKVDGESIGYCLLIDTTPEFFALPGEKIDKRGMSYLISHLRPYKKLIVQILFGFIVTSIFSLILPFLTQAVVDRGINYKDISFLTLILIAQFALTLGFVTVDFIRGWIMLHLTTRVNIALLSSFLARLMAMPISFFEIKMVGDLLQRMGDNGRIQSFITSTAINIVFSTVTFIVFSSIIAYYNWVIYLIFLAGSVIYILWIRLFLNYRRKLDHQSFAINSDNQSNSIQLMYGMQEIKLNNCEKQKRWDWERIQFVLFRLRTESLMVSQYQSAGATMINGSKNFLITYLTAKSVIDGSMTLGMMLSVQYILGNLNGPIEAFRGFQSSWQDAKLSLERLSEIESHETEQENSEQSIQMLPENKSLNLKDVSFQYAGPSSPYVLRNINLKIEAKKTTAIVGSSGSGKTTLVKLLLGFYKPVSGEILVGNTRLSSIDTRTWRSHLGTVLQEGFIFSDTVANNIAIGEEKISIEKLRESAKTANIEDFIDTLPQGYNTKIGASGNGLSAGQKQRILLARAVYKDPEYFFLDEATNALDSTNERTIMDNLIRLFEEKTVIIVAHRLSTVKHADKIIVMDKGELVEQGNHFDLLKLKGFYYNLVKNQLELDNG